VPQALAEMDQNIRWTIALGNAYYNQPQDVLDVIQIMRQRAQSAGNLQSGPQESVNYDQGYIQLAPTNPQIVYVPMYNPWTAYGEPVAPYRGFSLASALGSFFNSAIGSGGVGSGGLGSGLVRYGLGIAMSAFSQTPWGWLGWGLDWLGHNLLFHNSGYYSHSATLADWGLPHGGPRAAYYHGVMRANLPNGGYRQNGYGREGFNGNNRGSGYNSARDQAYRHDQADGHQNPGYASRYDRGPAFNNRLPNNQLPNNQLRSGQSQFPNAQRYAQNGYARPGMQAYSRAPESISRPQQYNRSAPSYSSNFSGNAEVNRNYAPRNGAYGGMQSYRSPSPVYGHEAYGGSYRGHDQFAGRSNSYNNGFGSNYDGNRGFNGYSGKPEKFGSSHFGGGKEPKMPKAPKPEKSHGGGHSGGGHSSGGHGGHHH
jgi:hypothetical protein